MKTNTNNFTTNARNFVIGIFSWIIMVMAIGLLFIALNYVALFNGDKPRLASVSGIISYFFTVVCIALLAVKIGDSIFMLDYCE